MHHKWIVEMTAPLVGRHQRRESQVRHGSVRSATFKNFLGLQKLKKAAVGFIVTHLTASEVGNLGDIFQSIDQNNDGFMNLQELDNALAHGDFSLDLKEKLKELRQILSLSGDERLNWKDFLAAMTDKSLLMREDKIKMAFEHFKKSDNQCLHWSDLVEILGGESQAKEIIGDIDTDGDGLISFEEFKTLMAFSFSESEMNDS
jgi:Ca2+-binding EF-hand superfamily protein